MSERCHGKLDSPGGAEPPCPPERRRQPSLDDLPIGRYRTTPSGELLEANPTLVRMLGFDSFAELARRNLERERFGEGYSRSEFRRRIERDGAITETGAPWLRRDGSVLYVREHARVVRDESGGAAYYDGVVEDITEQRRAETLLKLQRDLGQALGATESIVEALELLLDAVCRIEGIDAGCAYMVDAKTGALNLARHRSLTPEFVCSAVEFSPESPQARQVGSGAPHYLRYGDVAFADPVRRNAGFDALAILPIRSGGEVVAALIVVSRSLSEIPEGARHALEALAAQLGPVIARLRSAEALRASEARFRSVVDVSKDAIIAIGRDGRVTVFNPAAEEMFGWRRDEMLGETVERLMPVEHRARHGEDVSSFFTGGAPRRAIGRTLELPAVHRDGHAFTIELSLSAGPSKSAESVVAVLRDVSARKRAEEELRKFKTISDRANYGAAIADMKGKLTYVNDAFAGMHGYRPDELLGLHLSIFHTPEQMPRVDALNATIREEGSYTTEEVWHRRRDGSGFLALMNGIVICGDDGEAQYISATAIDITDRKRAEEAVRESEARYRTLVENITDGVALLVDGAVQYANHSFCEIMGRNLDEVVGRPAFELVAPEYRDFARQRVSDRLRGAVPSGSEYEVARPDGSRRHIEVVSSLIQKDGRPALLAVVRDVTARKQSEAEKTRLAEQLHEARRLHAIGEVAARIAHDFSNLLAVMRRALARLDGHTPDDPECSEVMQILQQALGEADQTTKTLMTFARRVPAERGPLNVCHLVQDSLRVLRHLLPENVRLEHDICADPGCRIRGDAAQLQQVLLNLTLNARDAMPDGGRLFVALQLSMARRPEARLIVRDTGVGMTPEVLARAFEPLFTTKPVGAGTGLGLTAVRSIVAEHDGRIDVRSQPGGGTTVTITFPLLAKAAPDIRIRGSGERIIVVDSNRHVLRLLVSTLKAWGFEAESCEPNEAATEEAFGRFADAAVLLLDVDASDERSAALLLRLRERGVMTPTIVTAELPLPAELKTAGDPRMIVLGKPFRMPELGAALQRLLSAQSSGEAAT